MQRLFSVRMRAALGGPHECGGRHISGAERLVAEEDVDPVVLELLCRARKQGVPPDFLRITVESVPMGEIAYIPCLGVNTIETATHNDAAIRAAELLREAGIADTAVDAAFAGLTEGWALAGGPLRGAVLMNAANGMRLEPDAARGVRVSRLDYAFAVDDVESDGGKSRPGQLRSRQVDALAIASKVLWAGALAEICWSDDCGYTTGYVATNRRGYVRLTNFKPNRAAGGRVIFLARDAIEADLTEFIRRIERQCVLIEADDVLPVQETLEPLG